MTGHQVEDLGLYQCVIYHPPKDPVILLGPVHLMARASKLYTGPRTVTQFPLPKSAASFSSLGHVVNLTIIRCVGSPLICGPSPRSQKKELKIMEQGEDKTSQFRNLGRKHLISQKLIQ
ncbi:hypothetical protein MC885_011519 [Smutsia gigantea]|nr:hypothetical protein MC885_011519 [Smutsia gigantea]